MKSTFSSVHNRFRDEFFDLLQEVIDRKVERVLVLYKDRISRVGFSFFQRLFQQLGTQLIIISEIGSEILDSQDVFNEIISLLHCYSMKL